MTLDTGYEKSSIELVEGLLDAHSPSTAEQVWQGTRDVSERAIAVVAAARADTGQVPAALAVAAQGLLAESRPRYIAGARSYSSGDIHLHLLGLEVGLTITNVHFAVSDADAGTTVCKVGVYSAAGILLASSANTTAALTSTGIKTVALSTPLVVPASGGYYVGALAVFSGTVMLEGVAVLTSSFSVNGIGAGVALTRNQSGLSDLPANLSGAAVSPSSYWFGLS